MRNHHRVLKQMSNLSRLSFLRSIILAAVWRLGLYKKWVGECKVVMLGNLWHGEFLNL